MGKKFDQVEYEKNIFDVLFKHKLYDCFEKYKNDIDIDYSLWF